MKRKVECFRSFLFFILFILFCTKKFENNHECRFWGIVFSEKTPAIASVITTHLDSLCKLGLLNPDGWGMGYFVPSQTDTLLPVIRRGEPAAVGDPRFSWNTLELLRNVQNSAVAHVRRGSSGLSGIPNPHPFRRKCINRRFDMLFAHNGTINVNILLELITSINPVYLEHNPPDYNPYYIDSDLYAILLAAVIDEYPDLTIEECINIAVAKLDSALGSGSVQLNFVMSDGYTLWALNFTKEEPKALTVHYYPDSTLSDFWVIASQPLDTMSSEWVEIPNRTLVRLRPREPVLFIPVYKREDLMRIRFKNKSLIQPNPFSEIVNIRYYVDRPSVVKINVYDSSGRLVKRLLDAFKFTGEYDIIWNGTDEKDNLLPDGLYFCHILSGESVDVLKIVLLH
ncbi:MAG: class II glutamine amidotransferase [candidate division WOR-3 bacterium]|nr:class II glutamine amidotransferase [candidate division WOR-3 bacterium]